MNYDRKYVTAFFLKLKNKSLIKECAWHKQKPRLAFNNIEF